METALISNMYNLDETIAKELFEGCTYPWEVLPLIKDFILKIGPTLSPDEYDKVGEDVWIAKATKLIWVRERSRPISRLTVRML